MERIDNHRRSVRFNSKAVYLILVGFVVLMGVTLNEQTHAVSGNYSEVANSEIAQLALPVETNMLSNLSEPLENWMFEPDYLVGENEGGVEPWMFKEEHLSSENVEDGIEPWMLDINYLVIQ